MDSEKVEDLPSLKRKRKMEVIALKTETNDISCDNVYFELDAEDQPGQNVLTETNIEKEKD